MVNIPYSQEEIDYIRKNYGKILVSEIAKKVNKTASSIRAKANELKLKSDIPNSKETHRKIALKFTKKLSKSSYLPSQKLAYILGVLNGDGYLTNDNNYVLGLGTIDKNFALYFKQIVEKWSKMGVGFYEEKDKFYKKGIFYRVVLNSKKVNNFLIDFYISQRQEKAIENIKKLLKNKRQLQIKFIKGFFDSEGYYSGNRVGFSNTNNSLILLVKEYLNFLGINAKIYEKKVRENTIRNRKFMSKKVYELNIQYKQGIINFFGIIKSCINRKNKKTNPSKKEYPFYFEKVDNTDKRRKFNEIITKYHSYTKGTHYIGKKIDWLIKDNITKRIYGVIGIANSFLFQGTRDRFIGWNKETRLRNINKIANNWRFCLLPDSPKNLASQILSYLCNIASFEWEKKYGIELVLLETYVQISHSATCYRAGNWQYIGDTKGYQIVFKNGRRRRKAIDGIKKQVFIYPLNNTWQKILLS